MRKNGCHPQARIASHIQRAYKPRSASTSTNQSEGMAPERASNHRSQYGRQDPSSSARSTFQATGMAPPLSTTLTANTVQRFPKLVASTTSGNRFSALAHKRTTQRNKGAKQVLT